MKELRAVLDRWAAAGDTPLVLATVVQTEGSTYRHTGARMLMAGDPKSPGPLRHLEGSISGGCLESDLLQRAWAATAAGPAIFTYDATADSDILWGFGLGCNGIVRVLVERLTPDDAVLEGTRERVNRNEIVRLSTVITEGPRLGERAILHGEGKSEGNRVVEIDGLRFLLEILEPPVRLTIFGAGRDALPLVGFAKNLGWHVTLVDKTASYANAERFPEVNEIVVSPFENLDHPVQEGEYVVVMTHNYLSDLAILRQLHSSPVPYIGLLGPPARRERLLTELDCPNFGDRLYGPVGLDIGADGPDQIALSIVAEIQAVRKGRFGGFRRQD